MATRPTLVLGRHRVPGMPGKLHNWKTAQHVYTALLHCTLPQPPIELATVPPGESDFMAVSVGELDTCGLRLDSTLRCWGSSDLSEKNRSVRGGQRRLATSVRVAS